MTGQQALLILLAEAKAKTDEASELRREAEAELAVAANGGDDAVRARRRGAVQFLISELYADDAREAMRLAKEMIASGVSVGGEHAERA
jgi:hypothetical protein